MPVPCAGEIPHTPATGAVAPADVPSKRPDPRRQQRTRSQGCLTISLPNGKHVTGIILIETTAFMIPTMVSA